MKNEFWSKIYVALKQNGFELINENLDCFVGKLLLIRFLWKENVVQVAEKKDFIDWNSSEVVEVGIPLDEKSLEKLVNSIKIIEEHIKKKEL